MTENSNGMKRRVDILGRVVIPKEVREILGINSGDLLEFFIDSKNTVVMKKFYILSDLKDLLSAFIDIVENTVDIYIFDTDNVICANTKITDKVLLSGIKEIIHKRQAIPLEDLNLTSSVKILKSHFFPIINNGDLLGGLLISGEKALSVGAKIERFLHKLFEN